MAVLAGLSDSGVHSLATTNYLRQHQRYLGRRFGQTWISLDSLWEQRSDASNAAGVTARPGPGTSQGASVSSDVAESVLTGAHSFVRNCVRFISMVLDHRRNLVVFSPGSGGSQMAVCIICPCVSTECDARLCEWS